MPEAVRKHLVVFSPSGLRGEFETGTRILEAARRLGVDLDSVCGGRGLCGRCQVAVTEGELARHGIRSGQAHLSPPGEVESALRHRGGLADGRRLGCQAAIVGDLAVDVPEASQVHRQVVRKPLEAVDMDVDPVVRLYVVDVPAPKKGGSRGDLERLLEALQNEWGIRPDRVDDPVRRSLEDVLRLGERRLTVAVREDREVIAAWPGFRDRLFGAAVDVGSTTIAAHLCDLRSGEALASAGCMNPQIRYGEDLMSRVSYAMINEGGAEELTGAVRGAVDALLGDLAREAGLDREELLELSLVGNPVMHHLLLGYDPRGLGQAPFALVSDAATNQPARDLDLHIHPGGCAYVLPCIAGHVGADMAGVLLAEAPWDRDDVSLLVDVGTNAEIVLGGGARLLAASSPTGPAFEGAQISAGQRAAPGAMERVRIDPETLEPRFRVIGHDAWSDRPDFDDGLPPGGVTGICGSGIIEAIAELFLAGVIDADGRIRDLRDRSPRIEADGRTFAYRLVDGAPGIRITQGDVRAIQLAKAALYAGCRLLMERLGVERVDRIRLAGAFGSHIDPRYAMVLGMIPDCVPERVSAAGNAAGTGARMALLSRAARRAIERRVRAVEKVETALEPRFQEHFVAAMAIPHRHDPFPALRRAVRLPGSGTGPVAPGRGRRRR